MYIDENVNNIHMRDLRFRDTICRHLYFVYTFIRKGLKELKCFKGHNIEKIILYRITEQKNILYFWPAVVDVFSNDMKRHCIDTAT